MPSPLRDVPDQAVELIKAFEGIPDGDPSTVNLDAYLCPAGIWTIGWGHALVDNGAQLKGAENLARARALYPGGITRAQAELLLRADLVPRAATVASLCKVPLDDNQFGALIALVFNIGGGNLGESTLLRLFNAGDTAGAAEQFLAWDKARVNGVLQSLAGLTRRRRAERALFLGEDWRAAGAVAPLTRGRAEPMPVLPVPEAPADQAPAPAVVARKAAKKAPAGKAAPTKQTAAKKAVAKKAPARNTAAKKAPARTASVKKAAAKKPAAKKAPGATPRARTTRSKATPPAAPAKRPAPRRAR
jgi:GH24 family phage-related lysozyme (muramidase)